MFVFPALLEMAASICRAFCPHELPPHPASMVAVESSASNAMHIALKIPCSFRLSHACARVTLESRISPMLAVRVAI
jgi:hypothetical protein